MRSNLSLTAGRTAVMILLSTGCQRGAGLDGGSPSSAGSRSLAAPNGVILPGAQGSAKNYSMRVSALEECGPSNDGPIDDGLTRVGVEVRLHASGELQIPANPYYALLIDGKNIAHEATLGGCTPALAPSLLAPGQTARGWISFDVPRESQNWQLSYAPELTKAAEDELVFQLAR